MSTDLGADTQYAAVTQHHDNGFQFKILAVPIPALGPSDILIRLSASGVCGTDLALAAGKISPHRTILGHEGVGRVVKLGSAITSERVPLGLRVGVGWIRDICGNCVMCMTEGGEERCLKQLHSGRAVDGTFAQYTVVPYRYLMPIPELMRDEEVAPILCGGVTVYKALKISGSTPGQWIVISGAGGGVGALGIQYAKAMGFRVVASDVGGEKRAFCLGLGAEVYVDCTQESLKGAVDQVTDNNGVSAAIVVAGSARAYEASLETLGPFGTLICVGIPPPTELVQFNPLQFIDMGIRIIGSIVGTREDVLEALSFVGRGAVVPTVQMQKLKDLDEICHKIKTGEAFGKFVLDLREVKM
ncbi:alcohol dehydrogenase [Halenospora varia]|nr:alcohol dehydrogenase [Halenospora varia]